MGLGFSIGYGEHGSSGMGGEAGGGGGGGGGAWGCTCYMQKNAADLAGLLRHASVSLLPAATRTATPARTTSATAKSSAYWGSPAGPPNNSHSIES